MQSSCRGDRFFLGCRYPRLLLTSHLQRLTTRQHSLYLALPRCQAPSRSGSQQRSYFARIAYYACTFSQERCRRPFAVPGPQRSKQQSTAEGVRLLGLRRARNSTYGPRRETRGEFTSETSDREGNVRCEAGNSTRCRRARTPAVAHAIVSVGDPDFLFTKSERAVDGSAPQCGVYSQAASPPLICPNRTKQKLEGTGDAGRRREARSAMRLQSCDRGLWRRRIRADIGA
ncbi:unnamed protein product [Rangifer tarandus platyrhynchus]|uniref:Uncharacterized protein n=1 Tax=Rangifer tarandus platyrhynchus TaxID=3082113 RepID=A0ABN8XJA6_RANTA|nr:unnamed protein product [Rangifer tarandus platyrhynchus]